MKLPQKIQSECGWVVFIDKDMTVKAVSENITELDYTTDMLLGKNLDVFISDVGQIENMMTTCKNYKEYTSLQNHTYIRLKCQKPIIHKYETICTVTFSNELYMLEIESTADDTIIDTLFDMTKIVNNIRSINDIEKAVMYTSDWMFSRLEGYDRAMVYKFAGNGDGKVIHENIRKDNIESYLGLCFPGLDIPKQARNLFKINGIRWIADIKSKDVEIVFDKNQVDIDMKLSRMRSVSGCHLQYLENMGVVATMSVAIVIADNLWGLYIFHRYRDGRHVPKISSRIMCDIVSNSTSTHIDMLTKNYHVRLSHVVQKKISDLDKKSESFYEDNWKELLKLTKSDGIILKKNEKISWFGEKDENLTDAYMEHIFAPLNQNSHDFFDNIHIEGYPFAGAACFRHNNLYIAFVRYRILENISWGGYPYVQEINDDLCPRTSFNIYVEKNAHRSVEWLEEEKYFLNAIFEKHLRLLHINEIVKANEKIAEINNERLDAISTAKNNFEFFAQMNHELRTPFHGVIGSLQLLKSIFENEKNKKDEHEIVESALSCSKSVINILDDILLIAKNKHDFSIDYKQVKMIPVIHDIVSLMSNFALDNGNKKIRLEPFDFEIPVITDAGRIKQIITNILSNAIKFSKKESEIVVNTKYYSNYKDYSCHIDNVLLSNYQYIWPPQDNYYKTFYSPKKNSTIVWLTFSVQDNGDGIDKNKIESIFEPYKQISSGPSKTHQGTGLGLHICKLLIKAMCGTINVLSSETNGTMFTCAIPCEKGVNNEVVCKSHPITINDKVNDKECSIIIVEDNKLNSKILLKKIQLVLPKCHILIANNGQEGYDMYLQEIHKLCGMFIDYHMPVMTGDTLVKLIRSHDTKINLIAFTADMDDTTCQYLISCGFDKVIGKPCEVGEIENISKLMFETYKSSSGSSSGSTNSGSINESTCIRDF